MLFRNLNIQNAYFFHITDWCVEFYQGIIISPKQGFFSLFSLFQKVIIILIIIVIIIIFIIIIIIVVVVVVIIINIITIEENNLNILALDQG